MTYFDHIDFLVIPQLFPDPLLTQYPHLLGLFLKTNLPNSSNTIHILLGMEPSTDMVNPVEAVSLKELILLQRLSTVSRSPVRGGTS